MPRSMRLLMVLATGAVLAPPATAQPLHPLSSQVEIRRTTHGVPHILADNLEAAAFALAWCQLEDYGPDIAEGLIEARGELALLRGGEGDLESDLDERPSFERAAATFHLLDEATRAVYRGFAAGVSYYVATHRDEVPEWLPDEFSPYDVLARDIASDGSGGGRGFVRRLIAQQDPGAPRDLDALDAANHDIGSNAWALAPSRTTSGNAILLRNPHLSWSAGYYEAHVRVPGVLDFYGDFRIGGPFGVIGGFSPYLGWATTNNSFDPDEFYALEADPQRENHYLFDGGSVPLTRSVVTVWYENGGRRIPATRENWSTALGPVIHRDESNIYVIRRGGAAEYRAGQQFLAMMKAKNLEEWKDAMRMQARATSNFTYADRDGNIFYVWNGTIPALPHTDGGDTTAIPATRSEDVWTRLIPFDSLPQVLNPPGGYLHNENDPFHFANLNRVLDADAFPPHFPEPILRLRSQHSILLLQGDEKLSLEDVVRRKHSYRMLLAERVKDDLVRAVRATNPTGDVARAIELMEQWDGTVAPDSRGGVLFSEWWDDYVRSARRLATDDFESDATPANAGISAPPGTLFGEPWSPDAPLDGPRGLADLERAATAFADAVQSTIEEFGTFDVAWGEVHRVRRGDVDVPVGGCSGTLGCFRVLSFSTDDDDKRVASSGDGWVLAVEFGDPPRAYSILGYGQTPDEESPFHADQAEMFARGEMKPVAFTEEQIAAALLYSYRPGER